MKLRILFLFISAITFAQQNRDVDFKTLDANLYFNVQHKQIEGYLTYTFDVINRQDTIYLDAHNMEFLDVKINGKKAKWTKSSKALKIYRGFRKGSNKLDIVYAAIPKQTLYFVKDGQYEQIWTQGQGKYTSHWLPSFDDVNEKVIFNISAIFNEDYTVLSNGTLKGVERRGKGEKIWIYQMDKPMSSYLVMLAIGKFDKQAQTTTSGTPLEFYLRQEDKDKFEPTYRSSKEIFDFFEKEIGVKYPWGIYRQVPVLDFLYAGMENTTSTIFAQDFVVDETGFNDRTYINVNAHELAHQWFGDLITAESSKHHWLQEGFATYYALLAEQHLYGEDHFNYELYQMAERLQQAAKTDTIPVMNEKASALTFYQKGAWALHVLREGIGDEAFRAAVKNYLEKYAYSNVNTDEFLAEVNKVSSYDTNAWRQRWLEKGGFEIQEAVTLLKKNNFMQLYFKLGELEDKRFAEKKPIFLQILQSNQFYPVKEEVLFQMAEVPFVDKKELIRHVMGTGDIKLRQAVARTVTDIPAEFVDEYITLLNDDSYITKEIVLNVLCSRFPARQREFLDKSDGWIGFNDKNLRILWLALAYTAPDYRVAEKEKFYAELQEYASSKYESSIRQNALANLLYIGKPDSLVLASLVNATLHHKWQFAKFGRDNIRALLKKPGYRLYFQELLLSLPEAEKKRLEGLLAE